jgi:AbrB family looped-hinge helix DNA binding protein
MKVRVTLDKAGRIMIPKPQRKELHLEPDDRLEMESSGEQITLRPVLGTGSLSKSMASGCFAAGSPCPPPPPMRCCSRSERNVSQATQRPPHAS